MFSINDALRLAERRRVLNVDGLCRLAAESVGRSSDDIVDLAKLAEGGFNRTFFITMRGGFQMVARIPYPVMVPKYYAVASEVATMALLPSSGLPVPEVYGYSPAPDNAAETEYIFMEFAAHGAKLSDVWLNLGEQEIESVLRQLALLESKMSIAFPAGGSLYYTHDLENVAGGLDIALEDARFRVGLDTRLPVWYGRRSQLDVDRGPYESVEAALARGAHKERAYLERFGPPLLPFQRMRRQGCRHQEQPPSDHIENLDRYLLIAPSLVPTNPALGQFRIRHPDLHPSNVIVSRTSDSDSRWQVVGLLDAPILPAFLLVGVPQRIQNYNDPVSEAMTRPALPANLKDLDKASESERRNTTIAASSTTTTSTEDLQCNGLHYAAVGVRRHCLFTRSRSWEGETLALKVALIDATANWEALAAGGGGAPCPVAFDVQHVRDTMKLDGVQRDADKPMEAPEDMIGFGPEGWVPTEDYEEAIARCKQLKEAGLAAAETAEERAEITGHWLFDDMNKEKYM